MTTQHPQLNRYDIRLIKIASDICKRLRSLKTLTFLDIIDVGKRYLQELSYLTLCTTFSNVTT